jgi:sugar phosphate isomerase/epimerase
LDFKLSEEYEMIRQSVRDFAEGVIAPGVVDRDEKEYFDRSIYDKMGELGLTGIDYVTLHGMTPQELKMMADDYGLVVACHTFIADLNHPDAAGRKAGVDAAKKSIEDAVALGTDKIMIPTGNSVPPPREIARQNYIAGLQELADFAGQAGITQTVENFPGAGSPFVIADDLLQAVREVPGMKITYDNGNAATGEDAAASFTRCAEHVVHAHYKDWELLPAGEGMQGLDGRFYRGALIGEGIVDHRACLQAMQQAGYSGYINIEYEGNLYTPADATRKAVAYLREVMAELGIVER